MLMTAICIRCGRLVSDVYLVCTECATELFGTNIFWIVSSPMIGNPVIDRYREESEPVLTIGERPNGELEFSSGDTTHDEIKNLYSEYNDDPEYIQHTLNKILTELGVPRDTDFDKYLFSPRDADIFAEIFYSLEEYKKSGVVYDEDSDLNLRIANLFFYTSHCADISAFEPSFRSRVVEDLSNEARRFYDISLSDTETPAAITNLGALLLRRGKYDESRELFENHMELLEERPESMVYLAELYLCMEESDKADRILDRLISDVKDDPQIWFMKGEVIRHQGRWGGAIQMYNQALKLKPGYADAIMMKGRVLMEEDMYDEADIVFNQMIKINDSDPRGWYWKGKAMHHMGKWGGALQCINEALSMDAQILDAWELKGDIIFERKVFEEAAIAYKNALELEPESKILEEKLKGCEERTD